MSKSKHTKDVAGVSSSFLVMSKKGQIIANCQPTGVKGLDVPFEEAMANATLFAAASALLAACEELLQMTGMGYNEQDDPERVARAKAAIAEAKRGA